MGKTLYLECYSGISGDMTVAALLDLGADCAVLDRVLKSLKVSGFETKISRVVKSGIDACDYCSSLASCNDLSITVYCCYSSFAGLPYNLFRTAVRNSGF